MRRAFSISGGTKPFNLPPNLATSLMELEEKKNILFIGHQKHDLNLGMKRSVDQGHLEFIVKIRNGAQALKNDLGFQLLRVIH